MGRVLAIDFGLKRVGIAVSDPLRIAAGPLTVLPPDEALRFLVGYLRKEPVDVLVVGDPLDLQGRPGLLHQALERFLSALEKQFPQLPVERVDERFTSRMARQTLVAAGLPKAKRRQKERTDQVSAMLILQHYLEKKSL